MANSITLPKGFTALIDEVYKAASVTTDLTAPSQLVKDGANVGEVQYPHLSVSGLGDYDRNSGYTNGAVDLKWETTKCNYDRGTKIQVDVVDDQESFNVAFGAVTAALQREKVAPEADAFTFATLAGISGISKGAAKTFADGAAFLDGLLEAINQMDEDEVPEEDRILYVAPTLLNSVIRLDTTKSREALDKFAKIQKVPQARFYTAIDLLDGKSGGEEAGHYKKADLGKDINFMIIHKPAVMKYDKHTVGNVIAPDANQTADAYMLKYRKYGLVDAYKNKLAGIYLSHKA